MTHGPCKPAHETDQQKRGLLGAQDVMETGGPGSRGCTAGRGADTSMGDFPIGERRRGQIEYGFPANTQGTEFQIILCNSLKPSKLPLSQKYQLSHPCGVSGVIKKHTLLPSKRK